MSRGPEDRQDRPGHRACPTVCPTVCRTDSTRSRCFFGSGLVGMTTGLASLGVPHTEHLHVVIGVCAAILQCDAVIELESTVPRMQVDDTATTGTLTASLAPVLQPSVLVSAA